MTLELKKFIFQVIHDIFYVSLATFVLYFFLEYLKPGLISNYLNLNLLLLLVLFSGMLTALKGRAV